MFDKNSPVSAQPNEMIRTCSLTHSQTRSLPAVGTNYSRYASLIYLRAWSA